MSDQLKQLEKEGEGVRRVVSETNSVNLSCLIQQYISGLPNPADWRVLAIDPLNDVVVVVREVKTP